MTQISNDSHEAGLSGVLPHFIHIFTFGGAIKWILEIVQSLGQFFEPLYICGILSSLLTEMLRAHYNHPVCYIPHQELRGTPQEVKYWTPLDLPTNISLFHLLYYLI